MARKIRWTTAASDDFESIVRYIAADSPAYAELVLRQILHLIEDAAQFPSHGRIVPELEQPKIRERLVYSYRIIYRVEAEAIVVLAILHGAQNFRKVMKNRN